MMDSSEKVLQRKLWQALVQVSDQAGLDATKFGAEHEEIVGRMAAFLSKRPSPKTPSASPRNRSWFSLLRCKDEPEEAIAEPISPIILCGIPGTGKTTFLYLLDIVVREQMQLPDNISVEMYKVRGNRQYTVQKRWFCGRSTSMLSVRKWTQLMQFYAWDTGTHGLIAADLMQFIQKTVAPMEIVFADEVEMTGYSPTVPDLAKQGILVVGSSNQYEFAQLTDFAPPHIYRIKGEDMRLGDPSDALVAESDAVWQVFERIEERPFRQFEPLSYQRIRENATVYALLNFDDAVNAPLLEAEWLDFFQTSYQQMSHAGALLQTGSPYVLLFDGFSMQALQTNYNAIIRFITLFDAIEQLGVGVLIKDSGEGLSLSRQALEEMKLLIQNRTDVSREIKEKTLVGLDRATSRIGQAAVRARHYVVA